MSWHHPDLYFLLFAAFLAFIYEGIQQFYTQKPRLFPEIRTEPKPLPADLKSFPHDGNRGKVTGRDLKKAKPPLGAIPGHTKWRLNYETPLQAENPG